MIRTILFGVAIAMLGTAGQASAQTDKSGSGLNFLPSVRDWQNRGIVPDATAMRPDFAPENSPEAIFERQRQILWEAIRAPAEGVSIYNPLGQSVSVVLTINDAQTTEDTLLPQRATKYEITNVKKISVKFGKESAEYALELGKTYQIVMQGDKATIAIVPPYTPRVLHTIVPKRLDLQVR